MAGTFSISFISFGTLFEKYKPNELSATFQKFENYRGIISSVWEASISIREDLSALTGMRWVMGSMRRMC